MMNSNSQIERLIGWQVIFFVIKQKIILKKIYLTRFNHNCQSKVGFSSNIEIIYIVCLTQTANG